MNREIKFEFWDNQDKCFLENISWVDFNNSNPVVTTMNPDYDFNEAINDIEYNIPASFEHHDIEVLQSTGLKDKNGATIFEGDILRNPPQNDWEKENYAAFEVFWHDNDCCEVHIGFQLNRVHLHGSLSGYGGAERMIPKWTKKLEIIGNIFENPELLTRSQPILANKQNII